MKIGKFYLKNEFKNRSGFVNIIGIPNSGKSTLMNKLIGKKVSIVSHKVQTTRFCIKGICLCELEDGTQSQIIFIDTPGVFDAKRRLDKAMVSAAWAETKGSDIIILIHDISKDKINEDTQNIIDKVLKIKSNVILILNKIDLCSKAKLSERLSNLKKLTYLSLLNFKKETVWNLINLY